MCSLVTRISGLGGMVRDMFTVKQAPWCSNLALLDKLEDHQTRMMNGKVTV